LQQTEIALDQCFLLGPGPTFHLPLRSNRIGGPVELLGEDQLYWSAKSCVPAIKTLVVFADAFFDRIAGHANVVVVVAAE